MSEQIEGSGPSELDLLKQRARLLGVKFSNNIGIDALRERVSTMVETGEDTEEVSEAEDTSKNFDDDIEEEEEILTQDQQPNGFTAAAQIAAAKVSAPPSTEIKPIQPITSNAPELAATSNASKPRKVEAGKTPTIRQHLYNEQMRLVRLRIQNLDPKKSDLAGEVIAVSNKFLGTVKTFVPYGEVTDDGWHIPYIIYKELERRRFLNIRTTKDPRTKQPIVKKGWAKEFALDILPPLSAKEISQLATAQTAAGSVDAGNNDIL